MPITIKIKDTNPENFDLFNKIAEEFFGVGKQTNKTTMLVEFQNNAYAQQFVKTIDPYFSGKSLNNA